MNAAVFLDRDNTIIHNDGDLGDPSQVRLIQGAASAIASLKGLNYRIIVVTNQGGVARGKYSEADVDRVNEKINDLIRANSGVFIDRFYYCPYHPEGTVDRYRRDHPWRKPRPGMLLQAARDLGLDLRQSWMIGDQMRDIQAGFSAGVVPILLSTDGAAPPPATALPPGVSLSPEDRAAAKKMVAIEPVRDFFVVRSLIEAVRLVGQKSRPTNVTAAMKTERIEVIHKQQPRSATASFDASAVTVLEVDREEKTAIPVKLAEDKKPAAAATDVDAMEQSLAVVNEAATEAAARRSEIVTTTKRRTRSDKAKPARGESQETAGEAAAAKVASTDEVVQEIESKVADPLIAEPVMEIAKPVVAQAIKLDAKGEAKAEAKPRPTARRRAEPAEDAGPQDEPASPAEPGETSPVSELERGAAAAPVLAESPKPERLSLSSPSSETSISPSAGSTGTSAEQTLRQILQELRSQRKVGGEFTYATVMAIVLQMVAGVCLLAALLMGSGNNDLFFRWMSCALMLQLATLAMLLFRKS